MSDGLPVARVVGPTPRGKLPVLRARTSCHVCHAGPLEECDVDKHDKAREVAKQSSWYQVWAATAAEGPRKILRIAPGEHPWSDPQSR